MRRCCSARFVVLVSLSLVLSTSLHASTVMQLNLGEMVQRADRIYRGTVVGVTSGAVSVGGGQLPTVTYRLRVDESFRGEFVTMKGVRIAELRTLGKLAPVQRGVMRSAVTLPHMPELVVGQTYLVMTTRPSAIGLSTTVGLGQGCFRVEQVGKEEVVANEVNNQGLFRGMTPPADPRSQARVTAAAAPSGAPLSYSDLAGRIRGLVAR
jgi:hypothetical protein